MRVARAAAEEGRTIVLVEGLSDKAAIDALAKRYGRNLRDEGITIVAIGGATKIWRFLDLLGPRGLSVKVSGLCDLGEERHFRRALERAGFGLNLTKSDMETIGFYICDADLEDELIRSLGVNTMLEVIAAQRDLGRFHLFRRQPEWQKQSSQAQLRRWLGTTAHRKISYAPLLVDALDPGRVPAPLERLLARVA
ncbi:MAG: ATP-dependent endonuclease [Verrucomicrobia bacterium]|nr:ATP-dependent endonuclease [Verrucomicrobiota bacterium]